MAENYVCNGAKIECQLCTNPEGTLMVTSNAVKVQDKIFATAKDNQKPNLMFMGNCTKSPFQAVPCLAAIVPGQWQGTADLKVQGAPALLESSTIMCNYGGVPITITDPLQVHQPGQLQPVAAPVIDPIEEPMISSLEWKSNKVVEDSAGTTDMPDQSIEETKADERVWVEAYTEGMLPGQQLVFEILDEEDPETVLLTARATVDTQGYARIEMEHKKL